MREALEPQMKKEIRRKAKHQHKKKHGSARHRTKVEVEHILKCNRHGSKRPLITIVSDGEPTPEGVEKVPPSPSRVTVMDAEGRVLDWPYLAQFGRRNGNRGRVDPNLVVEMLMRQRAASGTKRRKTHGHETRLQQIHPLADQADVVAAPIEHDLVQDTSSAKMMEVKLLERLLEAVRRCAKPQRAPSCMATATQPG